MYRKLVRYKTIKEAAEHEGISLDDNLQKHESQARLSTRFSTRFSGKYANRLLVGAVRGTVEGEGVCITLAVKSASAVLADRVTLSVVSSGASVSKSTAVVGVNFEVNASVSSLGRVGEQGVAEVSSAVVRAFAAVAFRVAILDGVAGSVGASAGVLDASSAGRVVTCVALDSALSVVAETFTVFDVRRAVSVASASLRSVFGDTSVSVCDGVA